MRKTIAIAILCLLGALHGWTQSFEPPFVPGELLVQERPGYPIERMVTSLNAQFPNLQASLVRELSRPMHIWQVRFNANIDPYRVKEAAQAHECVTTAQFNHYIQHRATTPNDPNFGQQWQYINTGAGGGVADADIDAELAWDFTTGGLTPFGDTIVACIIDDGLDLNHTDFGDNRWYNHQEIPNNNIDDDGNGYVDDFEGWDADNNDDDISGGGHGTSVTGIVGAKGDNGIGVAGVNWNVKLMIVKGGGNEAEAVAAYSYPLAMRKLWNQTSGAKGAFVVVTNASWGIDFGQPSQAPLWCAMYDSLGKYGVLSCGATANQNVNVDTQGDLPTGCPSDYLISVTNMNRSDVKVTQAGYGLVTIDLGAHGQDAYTTNFGGGYAGFGGTSGATPHVTGAVALLYSVACPNIAALSISHPDSAARLMKQFILDGTDPNTSLQNITTTGGRLNLHGSILQLLGWNCTLSGCYQAFGLGVRDVRDTTATLTWSALPSADSFQIDFRLLGDTTWTSVIDTARSLRIDTLRACTYYEFRVAALCDTSVATFSSIYNFLTDGCCEAPTGYAVSGIAATAVDISFDTVLAANSYTLRYAINPGGTWTTLTGLTSPSLNLTGLDSCTQYQFEVQTVCDTGTTPFGPTQFFRTTGCRGCEQIYCSLSANDASEEWIERVQFDVINNTSGSDNGYGDYTGGVVPVVQTFNNYSITLVPGFSFFPYNEYFTVYMDFNQDGDFLDAGELAYDPGQTTTGTLTGNVYIPNTATLGVTRMRVVMRFNTSNPGCGQSFDFGEVEDYCVEIAQGTIGIASPQATQFAAYPNPFRDELHIAYSVLGDSDFDLYMMNAMGVVVKTISTEGLAPGQHQRTISTVDLPAGIYFLHYSHGLEHLTLKLNLMK